MVYKARVQFHEVRDLFALRFGNVTPVRLQHSALQLIDVVVQRVYLPNLLLTGRREGVDKMVEQIYVVDQLELLT